MLPQAKEQLEVIRSQKSQEGSSSSAGVPNPRAVDHYQSAACQEPGHTAGEWQASERSFICRSPSLTLPPEPPHPPTMEKLPSKKLVPGAKKLGTAALVASEGIRPCQHLDSESQPPELVFSRDKKFVVLSHPVCGTLSRQPQESNTMTYLVLSLHRHQIISNEITDTIFFYLFIFLNSNLFIYLLAVLGLRCCAQAFSSCSEQRLLFIAVCGLLTAVASLVAEHGLQVHGLQLQWHMGSAAVARRLSSCGVWAQLLRGTWDIPGPGNEPVSPTLAGRFSTTVPPGKSHYIIMIFNIAFLNFFRTTFHQPKRF